MQSMGTSVWISSAAHAPGQVVDVVRHPLALPGWLQQDELLEFAQNTKSEPPKERLGNWPNEHARQHVTRFEAPLDGNCRGTKGASRNNRFI